MTYLGRSDAFAFFTSALKKMRIPLRNRTLLRAVHSQYACAWAFFEKSGWRRTEIERRSRWRETWQLGRLTLRYFVEVTRDRATRPEFSKNIGQKMLIISDDIKHFWQTTSIGSLLNIVNCPWSVRPRQVVFAMPYVTMSCNFRCRHVESDYSLGQLPQQIAFPSRSRWEKRRPINGHVLVRKKRIDGFRFVCFWFVLFFLAHRGVYP